MPQSVLMIFNGHVEGLWRVRNLLVIKQLLLVKCVGKTERAHDTSHQIKSESVAEFHEQFSVGYLLI